MSDVSDPTSVAIAHNDRWLLSWMTSRRDDASSRTARSARVRAFSCAHWSLSISTRCCSQCSDGQTHIPQPQGSPRSRPCPRAQTAGLPPQLATKELQGCATLHPRRRTLRADSFVTVRSAIHLTFFIVMSKTAACRLCCNRNAESDASNSPF